jgi:hypothetical protein
MAGFMKGWGGMDVGRADGEQQRKEGRKEGRKDGDGRSLSPASFYSSLIIVLSLPKLRSITPQVHVILWSLVVLTWMRDTIELV